MWPVGYRKRLTAIRESPATTMTLSRIGLWCPEPNFTRFGIASGGLDSFATGIDAEVLSTLRPSLQRIGERFQAVFGEFDRQAVTVAANVEFGEFGRCVAVNQSDRSARLWSNGAQCRELPLVFGAGSCEFVDGVDERGDRGAFGLHADAKLRVAEPRPVVSPALDREIREFRFHRCRFKEEVCGTATEKSDDGEWLSDCRIVPMLGRVAKQQK